MLYMYRIVTSTLIKHYINVIFFELQLISLESFLGYGHLKVICLYTERREGRITKSVTPPTKTKVVNQLDEYVYLLRSSERTNHGASIGYVLYPALLWEISTSLSPLSGPLPPRCRSNSRPPITQLRPHYTFISLLGIDTQSHSTLHLFRELQISDTKIWL